MSRPIVIAITVVLLWSTHLLRRAEAQDFRVYTSVTDIGSDGAGRRVVARSLTLFHAGRAYDHMDEIGELVIFEPIHERFILIRDYTATVVTYEELRQLLDVATRSADRYVAELANRTDADSRRACAQLQFQLRPQFDVSFDAGSRQLTLTGSEQRYVARGETANATVVAQYLEYADWAARLNSVLHSRATFPGPREGLNRALRDQNLLPLSVLLQSGAAGEVNLRANHEFRWQLQAIDKDLIHQWERLRESPQMRWVSFREYQQRLLATTNRESR